MGVRACVCTCLLTCLHQHQHQHQHLHQHLQPLSVTAGTAAITKASGGLNALALRYPCRHQPRMSVSERKEQITPATGPPSVIISPNRLAKGLPPPKRGVSRVESNFAASQQIARIQSGTDSWSERQWRPSHVREGQGASQCLAG